MKTKVIDKVCAYINRRIMTMDYNQEKKIREYIDSYCVDDEGHLLVFEPEVYEIAEILEVNEQCIYNMFVDELNCLSLKLSS